VPRLQIRQIVHNYGAFSTTPKLHPGPCDSVGMRPRTDPQTRMTTVHFASSTTHAKCNERRYYKEFNFEHRGKVKSANEHKNPLKSQPLQISKEYGTIPNLAETFISIYCVLNIESCRKFSDFERFSGQHVATGSAFAGDSE